MEKFDLRYGRGSLTIELPSNLEATVVRKPAMPILPDPASSIHDVLQHPTKTPALRDVAVGAKSACILICDITRPVPNHLFLRPMIQTLIDAGIPANKITVLVATGLHRPNLGDELKELVGDPWVLENVQVINHDAKDDSSHVDLGRTPTRETVVRLDRRFVESDIRIATGLVEPHFMAGYSGGRKVIAPGIAHAETITTFHSARFMADPAAASCNFDGNPLHEEQLQIIKLLTGDFPLLGLNTVIDEDRNLSFVSFGEILSSHDQAVVFARQYCEVPVERRFQTVITSAAGYPLDKTYYQTVKGMVGPVDILQPGGDLIIVSECSEGIGSPEYVDAQKRLVQQGPDAFLKQILKKTHADIDEWQTQMQLKAMSIGQIHLFAQGMSASDHQLTGVRTIDDLQQTIADCLIRNSNNEVAVIPEGPYVVPVYSGRQR